MPNPQISYALEPSTLGREGQLVDSRNLLVDARRNDLAASAEAAFGRGVSKSTNADDLGFGLCTTARQFLGVLVHSMDLEKTTTGLPNGEFGNVMRKGRVWVSPVTSVTTASPVKVYIASDTGTIARAVEGAFAGAAVSAKTATVVNARYLGACSADGFVELEIDGGPPLLVAD